MPGYAIATRQLGYGHRHRHSAMAHCYFCTLTAMTTAARVHCLLQGNACLLEQLEIHIRTSSSTFPVSSCRCLRSRIGSRIDLSFRLTRLHVEGSIDGQRLLPERFGNLTVALVWPASLKFVLVVVQFAVCGKNLGKHFLAPRCAPMRNDIRAQAFQRILIHLQRVSLPVPPPYICI